MLDLTIEGVRPYGAGDPVAIALRNGVIEAIGPEAERLSATERLDARGGLVLPSFVEPHIHLDKVLTRRLPGANVATWDEAEAAQRRVKRTFTADSVDARASRAIELAVANGVGIMRAHASVDRPRRRPTSCEGLRRAAPRSRAGRWSAAPPLSLDPPKPTYEMMR